MHSSLYVLYKLIHDINPECEPLGWRFRLDTGAQVARDNVAMGPAQGDALFMYVNDTLWKT